jgi:hypothetical protein
MIKVAELFEIISGRYSKLMSRVGRGDMPRPLIELPGKPLLEIASYARQGPSSNTRLTPMEIERIARTVARAPEVVVKVSGGAKSLRGALAHVRYIDRQGRLEIETEPGRATDSPYSALPLFADWDLDVADAEARSPYRGTPGRRPSKILHNVVLSMPAGTPAEKVLAASRAFAREQFALKHRYAMVLHTDQDHPHVHLVIKAMSEDGRRLNIRKATLREWRREFARQLRAEGVAANATERAVRGETRKSLHDGIYRAALRGESRHVQRRVLHIATQLRSGGLDAESGKAELVATREAVVRGWHAVAESLFMSGEGRLAEKIWKFIGGMPPPATDHELIASRLLRERDRSQERRLEHTR